MERTKQVDLKIPSWKLALIELQGNIEANTGIVYGKEELLYDRFHRRPLRNATIKVLNQIVQEVRDSSKPTLYEEEVEHMLHSDGLSEDDSKLPLAERFATLYYQLVNALVDEQEEERGEGIPVAGRITVGYPLANTLDKLVEHPLVEARKQRTMNVHNGFIKPFDSDQCPLAQFMLDADREINRSFWYIVKMLVKVFPRNQG